MRSLLCGRMSRRAAQWGEIESTGVIGQELVDSVLGDVDRIDDVAELEHLALCLRWPFDLPGVDAEWTAALIEPLERRGDELAAGLLVALAAFSHQPLGRQAANAVARLSGRGVVSPLADRVGMQRVVAASRHEIPDGEVVLVMMRRPRERAAQVGIVVIQSLPCGDVIEQVSVKPPVRRSRARKTLRARFRGSAPRRLAPRALLERLDAAAEHMIDHVIDLDELSATWLPAVSRALTGRADALPQLWVERPAHDDSRRSSPAGARAARRAERTRAKNRQARAARKRNRR
jgi:hypothetical protein